MADLFNAPAKPAPARNLHTDTAIYRAVAELSKFVTRAAADMRRDVKPLLGKMLIDETVWMAVVVRRANIARDAAKLPHLEELLEQVEIVQVALHIARDCGYLHHSTFGNSIPLTTSVAKQAMALLKTYAPAPAPVA